MSGEVNQTQRPFPELGEEEMLVSVKLPEGGVAGGKLRVASPDGRIFEIDIPEGVRVGESINIIVSKPPVSVPDPVSVPVDPLEGEAGLLAFIGNGTGAPAHPDISISASSSYLSSSSSFCADATGNANNEREDMQNSRSSGTSAAGGATVANANKNGEDITHNTIVDDTSNNNTIFTTDPNSSRAYVGVAAGGAVMGSIVVGGLITGPVIVGGAALYASSKNGKFGQVVRASGAKFIDAASFVSNKAKEVGTKTISAARDLDEKYDLSGKANSAKEAVINVAIQATPVMKKAATVTKEALSTAGSTARRWSVGMWNFASGTTATAVETDTANANTASDIATVNAVPVPVNANGRDEDNSSSIVS